MSDNPFEAPKSAVSDVPLDSESGVLLDTPRKHSIGKGWGWIAQGFSLFKLSPLFWIINIVIYFVILVLLSIVPLVSLLTSIIAPVFTAGLMYGAREVDRGQPMTVGHLFEGFKKNTGSLFAVGGLYLAGVFLVLIITAAVAYATGTFDMFTRVATAQGAMIPQPDMITNMLLAGLIYLALMIPLMMAIWFAPALVILNDVGAIESMKRSFAGCLKNMLPYLLYALIVIPLFIIAAIPLGLGLLVLIPVLTAALYASYKDIFLD